jgi:arylsulfatase A-like enzyme
LRDRRIGIGKVEDIYPKAMHWLCEIDVRPFFLFIHTYESHEPYTRDVFCKGLPHGRLGDITEGEPLIEGGPFDAPTTPQFTPEESLYIQAAYDGGVKRACDATVDLFSLVSELEMWENSVVVILSDHGEEFWEHSSAFATHHEASLYGEVLRVPFLIYDPDMRKKGMTFWDEDVTTVDLLPTVTNLLQVTLDDSCDGVSLTPLMRGRALQRRLPLMALTYPTVCAMEDWPSRPCIIEGGMKYIPALKDNNERCAEAFAYSVNEQLYLLDHDPGEVDNLADRMLILRQHLSSRLNEGLATAAQSPHGGGSDIPVGNLPSDLQRQLEALGYLDQDEQ